VGDAHREHLGARDTQFRKLDVKSGTGENLKAICRLGKIVTAIRQRHESQECDTMNWLHSEALMNRRPRVG